MAKNKWSNYDTKYMEESIEYAKKANNYNVNVGTPKDYQLYYYLYKAYNESKYWWTSNLDMARKFENHRPTSGFFCYSFDYKDYNIYDVTIYYNKSMHITELENQIEQKKKKYIKFKL